MKKIIRALIPYYLEFLDIKKNKQQGRYIEFLKFKLGINKLYWPTDQLCIYANVKNIYVGINSSISRPGNYLQGAGGIYIGNYVRLAPNVSILSSTHDLYDHRKSINKKIIIGDYSWVGVNSVVLPGVKLGTRTIVAAGSVVTKSFEEGYCVVAGTPAKVIKRLDKDKFKPWFDEKEFYGYLSREEFEAKYPQIAGEIRNEIDSINDK